MIKKLFLILFVAISFGSCFYSCKKNEKTQEELLVGTWTSYAVEWYGVVGDRKTDIEQGTLDCIWQFTFHSNGDYIEFYDDNVTTRGVWSIQDNKLYLTNTDWEPFPITSLDANKLVLTLYDGYWDGKEWYEVYYFKKTK